jgi:non-specific serine/threonine protein kinase
VRALLDAARLVTLTGAGGAGKTRLALMVAGKLMGAYPEGLWLVELAPLADSALVVQAVVEAVGLREEPSRPLLATLIDHLQGRHALLVLDNCEHLVSACAELAAMLLQVCPHLRVLATSRETLEVPGETTYRVPSLGVPDLAHVPDPAQLARYAAVQLFVQRARSRRPDFSLSVQNAYAVAQVCVRLDGMPLAIELAAARVGSLSVEAIATRLADRFRLLTAGPRTAVPRQQTLRAALDWSYDLLSEGEQRLLERLAVFAGGCTLEAAEAVCGGGGIQHAAVVDLLGSLVNKSLVQPEEAAPGVEQGRYRLLETVREYGRERLASREDAPAVHERHASYYLALAEEAAPYLNGPDERLWLARLDAGRDNVRAALRWFLACGASVEGLRLAAALGWYWFKRDAQVESNVWLAQLLSLPDAAPGASRAKALVVAGRSAIARGDTAAAHHQLDAALALARQLADRAALAQALLWRGKLAIHLGDDREARALQEESLALFRALGDHWGVAEVLCHLGRAVTRTGDHALAQTHLEEVLTMARGAGERRHEACALEVLGEVAFARGEYADAGRMWQESLALNRDLGISMGLATVENFLGQLGVRQGNYATARAYYEDSLGHQQGWGALYWAIGSLAGLAAVAAAEGQAERALRLAGAATSLAEATALRPPGPEHEGLERAIDTARASLDEQTATAAWAAGQEMPLEQAIALALDAGPGA